MFKKILRDPLLHFLLLGALLFQVYQWRNNDTGEDVIRVSADEVNLLVQQFQKTWLKAPNQEELKAIIDSYVLEELYAREAFKLDMHRDDPVVKRRMRMKMELLNDLLIAPPSQEEVKAFYESNLERYSEGHTFSFQHVYFSNKRSTTELASSLQTLRQNEKVASDPSMLRDDYSNVSMRTVQREFGGDFVNWLTELDSNTWQGPFRSPLGWHFVFLSVNEKAPAAPLTQVYSLVEEDVKAQQRQILRSKQQQELLQQYRVVRE